MYRFVITNNARVETLSVHSRVRHFGLVDRSSPGIQTINAVPHLPPIQFLGTATSANGDDPCDRPVYATRDL